MSSLDCSSELERLGTFHGWPGPASISCLALARSGFSYFGQTDAVICFACGLQVQGWERHHDPTVVHATQSPQCPMVTGGPSENKPVQLPPEKEYIKIKAMLTELGLRGADGGAGASYSSAMGEASCLLADTLFLMYGESMMSGLNATPSTQSNSNRPLPSSASSSSPSHNNSTVSAPGNTRRSPNPEGGRRSGRTNSSSRRGTGSSTPGSTPPPRRCSSTSEAETAIVAAAASGSATTSNPGSPRPSLHRAHSHAPSRQSRGSSSDTLANRQTSVPNTDHRMYRQSEEARLQTFQSWAGMRGVSAAEFAQAGFIYIGPPDRVQCVVCQGILKNWNDNDQPIEEHRKHFPDCGFVKEYFSRPAARTGPRHPKFKTDNARRSSFNNWALKGSPTPAQLVQAGFFYVGHGDSVKCFHCDGGLRNWEPNDDPWREHARWFPKCGFVKSVKGHHFIAEVLSTCSEYQSASVDETELKNVAHGGSSTAQRHVDPREVTARMDSPYVKAVLRMDIPRKLIKLAIKKRLSENGADFNSAEALLEAVFNLDFPEATNEMEGEESGEGHDTPSAASQAHSSSGLNSGLNSNSGGEVLADSMRLMEENRQLKEQRQCKICMDEEVCVAFLPCGHLVCCATCAPALNACPICRGKIRGTVRTYMS